MNRLTLEDDIDTLGAYKDGGEGLQAIRKFKPDVAILDINMPTLNGLQVVKHVRSEGIRTRLVVLTAHHDREQTLYVMRMGANAYAPKDIQPDDLVEVVRKVSNGLFVIQDKTMKQPQVREWIARQIEDLSINTLEDGEEFYSPLSPREMEILTYVTNGKSNKEIAQALKISQQTVKNHMTSILRKLNVEDRTQAAVAAIRYGWVRIND